MRGILIDPFEEKVTIVEVSSDYRDIYRHIKADCFTIVTLSSDDDTEETLYLDDNGLYAEDQRFFTWVDYPQPLAGRGLILGTDNQGDTASSKMEIDQALGKIAWLRDIKFSGVDQSEGEVDHPAFGKMRRISQVPMFDAGDGYDVVPASGHHR